MPFMAQVEISSFFARSGIPATDIDDNNPHSDGKNYPRLRIWEVSGTTHTLIVGDAIGTGQNTDGEMSPGVDTGIEDGFYTFVFTDLIGYDPTLKYLVRADGGNTLPDVDRYQAADISPELSNESIADAVWDEPLGDHLLSGSTGEMLDLIKLSIDTVLKYDTNRTKIDTATNEMIIYDDDCSTELRRFKLLDSSGNPSVTEVCERQPIDDLGNPICTP